MILVAQSFSVFIYTKVMFYGIFVKDTSKLWTRFRASKTSLSTCPTHPFPLPLPHSHTLFLFVFIIDRYKAVTLLQFFFVCTSVLSYVVFVMSLFVITCPSFGASEGLWNVIVAFPWYLYL